LKPAGPAGPDRVTVPVAGAGPVTVGLLLVTLDRQGVTTVRLAVLLPIPAAPTVRVPVVSALTAWVVTVNVTELCPATT